MGGVECRSDVRVSPRLHEVAQPAAEFAWSFEMLEHLLTDQKISRAVVPLLDIPLFEGVAATHAERVQDAARVVERERTDVETDAADPGQQLDSPLRVHPAAEPDLEEQLGGSDSG